MKNLFLFILLFIVLPCSAQRHISIFCDHIGEIARQENISFAEAASKVKKLGYNGVDVSVNLSDNDQRTLDSLGFQHASAISHINFYQGEKKDECRKALDFMRKNGYTRLLLVPGFRPDKADGNVDKLAFKRIKQFVGEAKKEGFEIMVEDFDNANSPCYNTAALDKLFKAVPKLGMVLDTGNFPFCGEDDMEALHHFRNRIHHLHLKDRKAMRDRESLAIGTGIVPLQDIITELLSTGYDGWFTVECYGAKNMLSSATISINNVSRAWDNFESSRTRK